jgi:hypothetical protein
VVVAIVKVRQASADVPMVLATLSQGFLLQAGNAVSLEIGLPGSKFFLGQQIARAYFGDA